MHHFAVPQLVLSLSLLVTQPCLPSQVSFVHGLPSSQPKVLPGLQLPAKH